MSFSRKSICVVLCTYNGEKYLCEQLESILGQTRPPEKILILDDGSHDRTVEIAEGFAKKDHRISLIKNELNLGYARNFEKGISLCETDYIALSDQDDVWFPGKLERLAYELDTHPGAGIAYCNAEYMTADGIRTGHLFFDNNSPCMADPVQARRGLLEKQWNVHGHLIVIDSEMKSFILPNSFTRTHGHDSWICLNAFFLRSPRYISDPLAYYRIHPLMASGAHLHVLRGTPFEFKKKWYDSRRLAKNLIHIMSSPFTRYGKLRERKLRAYQNASDMLTILETLLEKRKHLNLPDISPDESLFFQKKRAEWQAIRSSC